METRKIQKVGGSTFTVSVPKQWARRQGLETGEAVKLYTHRDGSLIVRGSRTDGEGLESVSFPIDQPTVTAVERSIQGAYEAGFERIRLSAESCFTDDQRRGARTIARQFVGTEVLKADAGEIVVQAMLDAAAVSIHQSIDQARTAVVAMQESVLDRLGNGGETGGQVTDRLGDVTRLVALIRRHDNRSLVTFAELDALGIDRVTLSQYRRVADQLEEIATATVRLQGAIDDVSLSDEHAERVSDRLATLRGEVTRATKQLLEGSDTSTLDEAAVSPGRRTGNVFESDTDPALARVCDHIERIDLAVQAIDRIAVQSAVGGGPARSAPSRD